MRPMLFCLSGTLKGATITPRETPAIVGTAPDCAVRFPPDSEQFVAVRHAAIEEQDGGFVVKSLTGQPIYVNDAPVTEQRLQENDMLRLGMEGPLIRFRTAPRDRTVKTFQQMIVDSADMASKPERRTTRATRMTAFARQMAVEAVANSTARFKLAFLVLAAVVVILAVLLIRTMVGAEKTAKKMEQASEQSLAIEADNERLRLALDEERQERMRLQKEFSREVTGRVEFQKRLEDLATRETARDESLERLLLRTNEVTAAVTDIRASAQAARHIHASYSRGVCFLAIGVSFWHPKHEAFLRYRVDPTTKKPTKTGFPFTLGGDGKQLTEWVTGSGFLVSNDGLVLSNRHVVDPWWKEPTFAEGLLNEGFVPVRRAFFACFPGRKQPVPVFRVGAHPTMDVAACRLRQPDPDLPALQLAGPTAAPVVGEKTILLGYPEGLQGIINKLDSAKTNALKGIAGSDREVVIRAIAGVEGIRTTMTQGVLSNITKDALVYSAVTASGGSGGPLFSEAGTVIGINTALSRDFTGANYGVPIHHARKLVTEALREEALEGPEISVAAAVPSPKKSVDPGGTKGEGR